MSRLDATGYLRGIQVIGSPITANLPIPDDDEAPALDPADDPPWTLLEQVTCSCGLLATPEPDEQYGTLWRCPCGRTYADEERQLLG